jgi:hypothetical protein
MAAWEREAWRRGRSAWLLPCRLVMYEPRGAWTWLGAEATGPLDGVGAVVNG